MDADPVRGLEIDQQHADFAIDRDVAHRQKHAVPIKTGEGQGSTVDDFYKTRITAFVGTCRVAAMIDGCKEEHIPAFDKTTMLLTDFRRYDIPTDGISQVDRIEILLKC